MGPRSVGRGKAAYKRFVEQDLAAGAIHSPRGYKIIGFPQNRRFCGMPRSVGRGKAPDKRFAEPKHAAGAIK